MTSSVVSVLLNNGMNLLGHLEHETDDGILIDNPVLTYTYETEQGEGVAGRTFLEGATKEKYFFSYQQFVTYSPVTPFYKKFYCTALLQHRAEKSQQALQLLTLEDKSDIIKEVNDELNDYANTLERKFDVVIARSNDSTTTSRTLH